MIYLIGINTYFMVVEILFYFIPQFIVYFNSYILNSVKIIKLLK